MPDQPTDPSFRVETYRRPGCVSLDIFGGLTSGSATTLQALIRREAEHLSADDHLRIGLLRCTQLASAVITMLKDEQEHCSERDVVLYLASVPDRLVARIDAARAASLLKTPWV